MAQAEAGFSQPATPRAAGVDARLVRSWIDYLVGTLGRTQEFARRRAWAEIEREGVRKLIQHLSSIGWTFDGRRILDVGSGHGALAVELALAGADVTAVEPCDAWRELSSQRARSLGVRVRHCDADAHRLPFPAASFDACVSLQVLEHVERPRQVIREMARALRPGGQFFVSCENYLAFWEPHYGLPWLPGLPKTIAAVYLRLCRRDPAFLQEHIQYVYWPLLVRWFAESGLIDRSWGGPPPPAESLGNGKRPALRCERVLFDGIRACLGTAWGHTAVACAKRHYRMFVPGFSVEGTKCLSSAIR